MNESVNCIFGINKMNKFILFRLGTKGIFVVQIHNLREEINRIPDLYLIKSFIFKVIFNESERKVSNSISFFDRKNDGI